MSTINIELTFDQLLKVIRKLPYATKMRLWEILDEELNHVKTRELAREKFAEAVHAIRAANKGVTEDEVMADATAAVQESRAERRARGG